MKVAAAIAAFLAMAACGGSGKRASLPTAPSTGATSTSTTGTSAPSTTTTAPAAAGSGNIALVVRAPLQFSGTIPTSVVCDNERGHYAAVASSFPIGQDTVSMSVNISGYNNPQIYTTPVTVEFLAPDGTSDKVTDNIAVKVVDPQHGQFTIKGVDDLGKMVDADFNWTCS